MDLTSEEKMQYTQLIDKILVQSDLSTISEKRIRKQMQEMLPEKDIAAQKSAISKLIIHRFDQMNSKQESTSEDEAILSKKANGVKREVSDEPPASDSDLPPPKKKVKSKSAEDADALLAAKLQAQENSRARPSRTGVVKKAASTKKKKAPKKKSAAKIKGDDDSDVELGSDGEPKVIVKKGGFHKPYYLSEPLQVIVGTDKAARTMCVKKLWEHIHALDLQDPSDKRQILCDDKMQNVFKVEKLHMFTMNKLLGKHLYPIEEEEAVEAKVEKLVKNEEDDD